MQTQQVILDVLKPTGTIVDLSDSFNARVGDKMTPFQLFILEGGVAKDLKGMHPELEAVVGNGALKGGKAIMNAGAKGVHWVGSTNNVTGYNQLTLAFPAEVFPQSGFCYGHLILANEAGVRESSVDIWFQVLDGTPQMGMVADHYDSELALELAKAKNMNDQFSQEMRAAYNQQVTDAQNALTKATANLNSLAGTVGDIQAQLSSKNLESQFDHSQDIQKINQRMDGIQNGVTAAMQKINLQPKWYSSLDELNKECPNGGLGIFIVNDKLATFQDKKWTINDEISINSNMFSTIINSSNMKAPYDSLGTLPRNSYIIYSSVDPAENPFGSQDNFGVTTIGQTQDLQVGGTTQIAISQAGNIAYRFSWGNNEYSRWFFAKFAATVSNNDINSIYLDIDKLPGNSVISYDYNMLKNVPWDTTKGCTIITIEGYGFGEQQKLTNNTSASIQLAMNSTNELYVRFSWGYKDMKWGDWKSLNNSRFFNSTKDLQTSNMSLENLQSGDVLTFGNTDASDNLPWNSGFTVMTLGNGIPNSKDPTAKIAGQAQLAITKDNELYTRIAWYNDGTEKFDYSKWRGLSSYGKYSYKPSLAIFNKFAIIGDSYSAGNIHKDDNTAIDDSYLKWGSFIAKKYGTAFTSLAYSGYTTQSFVQDKLEDLKNAGKQDAYFIALGINDSAPWRTQTLGSIDDLHNDFSTNPDTFYGNYGRIIEAIKKVSPSAKIIPITIMSDWGRDPKSGRVGFDKAIKGIAKKYNLPVVDVLSDPYFESDEFYHLQISNHPTAVGYAILAERLEKLIQKVIIDNPEYFADTGIQFS